MREVTGKDCAQPVMNLRPVRISGIRHQVAVILMDSLATQTTPGIRISNNEKSNTMVGQLLMFG